MTESMSPVLRTPLDHWHAIHGVRRVVCNGWPVPAGYATIDSEIAAVTNGIGLADLTACTRISLHGPGIKTLAARLAGDRALAPGQVVLADEIGQSLACRFTDEALLLLGSSANADLLEQQLQALVGDLNVLQHDATSAWVDFLLIGARIDALFRSLTPLDVSQSALARGKCVETSLAGVHTLLVRPPKSGPSRLHVCVAWDLGEFVWETLLRVGKNLGITPIGTESLALLDAQ